MLRAKFFFKSANVSRSYSKNNNGTYFLRHSVVKATVSTVGAWSVLPVVFFEFLCGS